MPSPPIALPDRISGWRSIAINGIIEFCESIFPHNSSTVFWQWTPGGLSAHVHNLPPALVPNEYPWERIPFGFKRSGNTVTIKNGELHWSDHGFYTVADTDVTISAVNEWIGVEFDGTTLSIPSASSSKNTFQSDATTYRTWLYRFESSDSLPTLINPVGIIELDANFG